MNETTKKKRSLKSIKKAFERPAVPSSDDPREELRRLVMQHKALTKAAVAIDNMARDKQVLGANMKPTGDVIKCRLPEDVQVDLRDTAKRQRDRGAKLESAMKRELKKIPIYQLYLQHVYGVGPVLAAYLIVEIDIHKAVKPSNLRRFLGLAVIDGRLERRTKGEKNHYSTEMRTRLWQFAMFMRMNAAKVSGTTKYLKAWEDFNHRMASAERVSPVDETSAQKRANTRDETSGVERKRKWNKNQGWVKAADLFVTDLYVVWRALEGLPVWPSYLDGVLRGCAHGTGEPVYNAPQTFTIEQALEYVGDLGIIKQPVAAE